MKYQNNFSKDEIMEKLKNLANINNIIDQEDL